MIIRFRENLLSGQLYLVSYDASRARRPVRRQRAVTGDPFCTYIGIDLDRVRAAVITRGRDGHVREWEGLAEKIVWLHSTVIKLA